MLIFRTINNENRKKANDIRETPNKLKSHAYEEV